MPSWRRRNKDIKGCWQQNSHANSTQNPLKHLLHGRQIFRQRLTSPHYLKARISFKKWLDFLQGCRTTDEGGRWVCDEQQPTQFVLLLAQGIGTVHTHNPGYDSCVARTQNHAQSPGSMCGLSKELTETDAAWRKRHPDIDKHSRALKISWTKVIAYHCLQTYTTHIKFYLLQTNC